MIKLKRLIQLAWRQFKRDSRSGELKVLMSALILTVLISTSIAYFSQRLQGSMLTQMSEFLAADLVLSSSDPTPESIVTLAQQNQLETAQTLTFSTILMNQDALQLVSAKAVSDRYPLRGVIKIKNHFDEPETEIQSIPEIGTFWADERLFYQLDLKLGDELDIGNTTLKLTHILVSEPDRNAGFNSLNPHILMNLNDVAKTQVVQPGSRVNYRFLVASDQASVLTHFQQTIQADLNVNLRLIEPNKSNERLNIAFDRAQTYLNLTCLIGILIAAAAIALSANQFTKRRFNASALMRCLGLTQKQTFLFYAFELLMIGLFSAIIGALLGFFVQMGLFYILRDLIPGQLPASGFLPALSGILTGLIVLLGFGLPPLITLSQIPPIQVLRETILIPSTKQWLSYLMAIAALFLVILQMNLSIKLILIVSFGLFIMVIVLGFVCWFCLKWFQRSLKNRSFIFRLGVGQLLQARYQSIGQMIAFGIILMTMALIFLLRSELLSMWKDRLPDNAPNYFAFNIAPDQKSAFAASLKTISPDHSPFYPIVMGRLTAINNQPIQNFQFDNMGAKNVTARDLNLTWSDILPDGNLIVAGNWWHSGQSVNNVVDISIEAKMASDLHVQVGDELTFLIAGEPIQAQITSIRQVDWETLQPNFFVIFNPNSLGAIPVTYLTSFYLAPTDHRSLIQLSKQFPTVTLFSIEALLNQLFSILAQMTIAVEGILGLVLVAGVIVLIAGLQASLSQRIKQNALLRALGAKKSTLYLSQAFEFGILGFSSGLIAWLGCEVITFVLYNTVLDLTWQWHPILLGLPMLSTLLIIGLGLIGTQSSLKSSPIQVLRS